MSTQNTSTLTDEPLSPPASADVRFGQDENTHGRFPGGGSTIRFPREAGDARSNPPGPTGSASRTRVGGLAWTLHGSASPADR